MFDTVVQMNGKMKYLKLVKETLTLKWLLRFIRFHRGVFVGLAEKLKDSKTATGGVVWILIVDRTSSLHGPQLPKSLMNENQSICNTHDLYPQQIK